ncbi:MAG: response regulator [Pseudomonadota bacterium]
MINAPNVFVVDDDAAVRDSLRMMLKAAGYTAATFSGADEFLAACNSEATGCIILDVNMPGMDGPSLQEELNRRGLRLPIIFLTGQGSIPLSVRTMKAGAMDFFTKPVDGTELLACVKQALDKSLQLGRQARNAQSIAARLATLTKREKEVMMLIIAGLTNKEVAKRLSISFRTVENHRAQIMQKTGSSNTLELARIASSQTSD